MAKAIVNKASGYIISAWNFCVDVLRRREDVPEIKESEHSVCVNCDTEKATHNICFDCIAKMIEYNKESDKKEY